MSAVAPNGATKWFWNVNSWPANGRMLLKVLLQIISITHVRENRIKILNNCIDNNKNGYIKGISSLFLIEWMNIMRRIVKCLTAYWLQYWDWSRIYSWRLLNVQQSASQIPNFEFSFFFFFISFRFHHLKRLKDGNLTHVLTVILHHIQVNMQYF